MDKTLTTIIIQYNFLALFGGVPVGLYVAEDYTLTQRQLVGDADRTTMYNEHHVLH